MTGESELGTDGELSARLHELVRSVDVAHMSPAGVQRRVHQRAQRRRFRRGLRSAAFSVALVLVIGAWTTYEHGGTNRVITRGPLVPAAPAAPPASSIAPSDTAPPMSTTTVPATITTIPGAPAGPPGSGGRSGDTQGVPTARGGDGKEADSGN